MVVGPRRKVQYRAYHSTTTARRWRRRKKSSSIHLFQAPPCNPPAPPAPPASPNHSNPTHREADTYLLARLLLPPLRLLRFLATKPSPPTSLGPFNVSLACLACLPACLPAPPPHPPPTPHIWQGIQPTFLPLPQPPPPPPPPPPRDLLHAPTYSSPQPEQLAGGVNINSRPALILNQFFLYNSLFMIATWETSNKI